ncbi:hypothetical protein ACWIG5_20580 [Streptomyces lydicus]
MGYRQGTIWLTPDARTATINALRDVLESSVGNDPAPGRRPHMRSAIFFPTEEPPQHGTDKRADHDE